MNYYNILGISSQSSIEQIKQAYRNLARLHHPDKNPQSVHFRIISEAYRILSNPQLRQRYDQTQIQIQNQIHMYHLIRNFINNEKPQKIDQVNNDNSTKDTEMNDNNDTKQKQYNNISKKKIRKEHK